MLLCSNSSGKYDTFQVLVFLQIFLDLEKSQYLEEPGFVLKCTDKSSCDSLVAHCSCCPSRRAGACSCSSHGDVAGSVGASCPSAMPSAGSLLHSAPADA